MTSIADNYVALQKTWDSASDATKHTETRARIRGVAAQMEMFDFFFGVELGRKILNMADNLSRSLQATLLPGCDGQRIVKSTLETLQSIRTEECFDLFCSYLEKKRSAPSVSSPSLPRRRKVPK